MSLFPSALLPWVNFPMTVQAWSLLSGNQTSVCFSKEMIAFLTLRDLSRPDCQEGKELCRGPTAFGEMPSKPGRDDQMAGSIKPSFLNLGETCAYVFWERAINCHAGHAVSRMPEPLEIGFGFTHTLEGCRIAGLHVDRSDFPRVIIHRVSEAAVAVLHAGLLDVSEEVGWGWLPAMRFLCHNASRVVIAEGSLSKFRVAQFGADRLESFVGLSCPVGAAVLEHELVDRELSVLTAQEPDR